MQVRFGAMAPSLIEQGFDDMDGHLQKDIDAITRLAIRGAITNAMAVRAEKWVVKMLKALPQASPIETKEKDNGRD